MSFRSDDKKRSLSDTVVMSALPVPVVSKVPSTTGGTSRRKKNTRFALSGHWAHFIKRFGSVSSPTPSITSSELARASSEQSHHRDRTNDPNQVDRIVVDRTWTSESRAHGSAHDDDKSPETKSSSAPVALFGHPEPSGFAHDRFQAIYGAMFRHFFSPSFPDDHAERSYIREDWSFNKSLARWSALWLILSWALGAAFAARPRNVVDEVFLYGIALVFTVPVLLLVAFDWPRDHPVAYQVIIGLSLYMWGIYYVLMMMFCGTYTTKHKIYDCPTRDFIGLFYYMTALPTLGLFGLKLQRITAAIGGLLTFVFTTVTLVPNHTTLARTMVNYFLFLAFIIYAHYMKERAERRLYSLRMQLQVQFRATQRAQINERKAADSKRRLTSYVFHEVRVPLNSALLAVQNINSSGAISRDHEIEFNALSGSLNMMRGVLNDVLDFNRMDSGTFEVSSRPFAFHTIMRSLFVPLQLSTDARGQDLVVNLDPNIDKVARWAAYQAMGETSDVIKEHMREHPEVAGVVTGDHVRLNQIVNNLASNATKFTPAGGRITITTKLVYPRPEEVEALENYDSFLRAPNAEVDVAEMNGNGNATTNSSPSKEGYPLSRMYLSQHNLANGINPTAELKRIVVRIEVTDTGYGITRRDMDECNLFSAFNQTAQGKLQGGKGTGLGLALVRQIVKLSGGRLGVRSKAGEGSCFWIELPLGVGREALVPPDMESEHSSTDPDLNKVRVAARTSADIPISKHSLTVAVDTVALKNSQIRPPSDRSNSAIHNIMEQGGRVELAVPRKSTDPLPGVGLGVGVGYMPSPLSSDVTPGSENSTDVPNTPSRAGPSNRPTYLPMPSPKRFMKDAFPTTTSSLSNMSSPLAQFDSNYQGIPTSTSDTSLVFDAGLSVLVVDDDLVTRKLMQRMLVRLGCVVQTAENGQAALVTMGAVATPASEASASSSGQSKGPILERPTTGGDEEKFDIVFLDNQMPVLSGLNTVAKLREWGRADLVVGVTGNALLEDQEEYIAAGADHVLTKPVNEQALRRMLVLADSRRKARTPTPPQPP